MMGFNKQQKRRNSFDGSAVQNVQENSESMTVNLDCNIIDDCALAGVGVLHIGNTAAIPQVLRDGLREAGVKSDIMIFYPDVLKQGSDFAHPYSKWIRLNLPLYGVLRVYHMLKKCADYKILHFHAFGGLTFYLDYPLWRILGKRIILHYHGTELRRFGKECPFAKLAHRRYVSTLDLLPLAPGAVWLPSPTNMVDFPYVGINPRGVGRPVVVLNAVASEEHGVSKKGLNIIRAAIQKLIDRGYNIEFRSLIGVPYAEALRQYREADIVIGQTHIGWYGKLEQECMAFGKPVVTYIDPKTEDLLKNYQDGELDLGDGTTYVGIPVGNFIRDDADSLADRVASLIDDYGQCELLSRAGRKYVQKWHDSESVMKFLKKEYVDVMGEI